MSADEVSTQTKPSKQDPASSISADYASINGMRIFYRYAGSGDPVILLHGSHRSSYIFNRNIPVLAQQFSVYAPDRPGYGQSQAVGPVDPLPDMVDFAYRFMREMGFEFAHWIGESRGGGICIQLAATYPSSVDHLVLVDSIGLPPNELPKPPELETRSRWEWFIERSFEDPTIVSDDLREVVLADLEKAASYEQRRLALVPKIYNERGLLEEIVKLSQPTLLVWGRQDPVFPVETVERFRQLIPALTEVVVVDNARHLPFYEHPAQFNRAVVNFLSC